MSRLIDFYRGTGRDGSGRLLADVWAFSEDELEFHHDFIQWLFPLTTISQFNPSAPTLKEADIAAFRDDPALRDNLRRSFDVFLAFLGFQREGDRVVPADDFDAKSDLWRYPNHNWLRITRVLTCLKTLGLEAESLAFFEALKGLRDSGRWGIDGETFGYWESAISA
ncbi:MAG: opioid growth factor receptor-related protein [Isosphaeraceae bacterium]